MVELDRAREIQESGMPPAFSAEDLRAVINPPDPYVKDGTLVPGVRNKNGRRSWFRPIEGGWRFVCYIPTDHIEKFEEAMGLVLFCEPQTTREHTIYPSWEMNKG